MKRRNGGGIVFGALYLKPSATIGDSDLEAVSNVIGSEEAVLGGDLNSKHPHWGGSDVNRNGRKLYDWILSSPDLLVRGSAEPTRVTSSSASYIDLFIVSAGVQIAGGINNHDYESDHKAIQLDIRTAELMIEQKRKVFDFGTFRQNYFNHKLMQGLEGSVLPVDRNATIIEIDRAVEGLTVAYREAMKTSMKQITIRKDFIPRLPDNIRGFISEKKTMLRRLHRTVEIGTRNRIKAIVRNMDRIIQQSIRLHEEEVRISYLERIRLDRNMHSRVRRCAYLSKCRMVPDLVDSVGGRVTEDRGKAELLAQQFSAIQDPGIDLVNDELAAAVGRAVATLTDNEPLLGFDHQTLADGSGVTTSRTAIKPSDIGAELRRINCKKSSGDDGIPNFVLRRTDQRAWKFLAILFNQCLNIGYFPRAWKHSRIVPVVKPGKDPTDVKGYRPISLLSNLGKFFERFILKRVRDHIEVNGTLRDFQFGFREGLSTNHALLALSDRINRGLNKRRVTIAVSLDFEKAFDTVWQNAIVYKMLVVQGFDRLIARIVLDYLRDRTFSVGVGEGRSSSCRILAGVPQGSILGPVLYNIYLSDIPSPPTDELMIVYADDILVATTHARAKLAERRLNQFLQTLEAYFLKWRLKLNIPKCRSIIFKGRKAGIYKNARQYSPRVLVRDQEIQCAGTIRYLGVVFQENMSFISHIDHILDKCKKRMMIYRRVLESRRGLSSRVRLTLYKTIIRPVAAYAFPIWFNISSHQMERLRVMERKVLRSCLGLRVIKDDFGNYKSPSCRAIYDGSGIERFDSFAIGSAIEFLRGILNSTNSLMRECLVPSQEFDDIIGRKGFLTPVCLLNLKERNMVYDVNGLIVYFHRRYGSYDLENLVYNTTQ